MRVLVVADDAATCENLTIGLRAFGAHDVTAVHDVASDCCIARSLVHDQNTIMNTLLRISCLWLILFGFSHHAYGQGSDLQRVDTSNPGIMNDQGLRGITTTAPAPSYPATSLGRKVTGVAVAAILIDQNGHLQSLKLLQAPDEAIGRSVHDALMRWTFRPTGIPMKGKLFFYFTIKRGAGTVESPEEMSPTLAAIDRNTHPAAKQGDDAIHAIDETHLDVMRRTGKPSILDVRDRAAYQKEHRNGAVNIPVDELLQRALIELPLLAPVVVDCSPEQPPSQCRMAGRMLMFEGFDKVSVLIR